MKCFQLLLISSSCLFFERFTWVSQFSLTLLLLVIWTLNYKCTRCLLKMTPISKQFSAINFPLKIYNFRTISLVAIPLPGTKNNLTEWNKTKHNATSTHCGPIIFLLCWLSEAKHLKCFTKTGLMSIFWIQEHAALIG